MRYRLFVTFLFISSNAFTQHIDKIDPAFSFYFKVLELEVAHKNIPANFSDLYDSSANTTAALRYILVNMQLKH
jgi:hypothetical protein